MDEKNTYRTCGGCIFQRCFMSDEGHGWRCSHPDADGRTFSGDDTKVTCLYGCKRY